MERMFTEGTEGWEKHNEIIVINFYNVKVGETDLLKLECF